MASVFREKSLEAAASPDHLDNYIHVSGFQAWMIIAAIVLLLVAGTVWACFGTITEKADTVVVVKGGEALCYVAQDRASALTSGDALEAADVTGMVTSAAHTTMPAADAGSQVASVFGEDAWVVAADASLGAPDGTYVGTVTLEEYEPMALLFNASGTTTSTGA